MKKVLLAFFALISAAASASESSQNICNFDVSSSMWSYSCAAPIQMMISQGESPLRALALFTAIAMNEGFALKSVTRKGPPGPGPGSDIFRFEKNGGDSNLSLIHI